jgi:hypothetical protein
MNDLLGGQVDFMCDQTTNTTSQIKSGKVKAYGVTTAKRVPSLPDLPTLQEQGLKGFEVSIWHALYAPKNTPQPVVDTLVKALHAALKDPTVIKRFADLGTEPVALDKATPAYLQNFLNAEIKKWGPIIKAAGAVRRLCPRDACVPIDTMSPAAILRGLLFLALSTACCIAHAVDAVWAQLRAGGLVVFIRHADTDPGVGDPPGFRLDDCKTQRNLSAAGREQARRLAQPSSGAPVE